MNVVLIKFSSITVAQSQDPVDQAAEVVDPADHARKAGGKPQ